LVGLLLDGIASSLRETLEEHDGIVPREHLAGAVLSALGTSYYRLACSVVAMTEATPAERAEFQERNRAGVLEGLQKMCHGISLVGDTNLPPVQNLRLN
jgi:hypothetical protein